MNFNWKEDDILTTDKYKKIVDELKSSDIKYIKTDVFYTPSREISWRGENHRFEPKKVIVSGHSDHSIHWKLIQNINKENNSKIHFWFGINMDMSLNGEMIHPVVYKLPLGITNNSNESELHSLYGNTNIMYRIYKTIPREHRNLVYMNINVTTYPEERLPVFNLFKNKPWVTVENPQNNIGARENFLKQMRWNNFVICPRGNGIDTHRMWEALYMECIPIVKRHQAFDQFYDDFPICWIDDWSQVTVSFLENEYLRLTNPFLIWNWNKLKIGYWKRLIESCLDF